MKKFLILTITTAVIWTLATLYFSTPLKNIIPINDEPIGVATVTMQSNLITALLNKPGGFQSNDALPPVSLFNSYAPFRLTDDMPEFETGAVKALRDFALILRDNASRSGSQSIEDENLMNAQGGMQIDTEELMFPNAEKKYEYAAKEYMKFVARLKDSNDSDGVFAARVDVYTSYLEIIQKRIGNYAQRLTHAQVQGSIAKKANSGDENADVTAKVSTKSSYVTPWMQVDNEFHEPRGYIWVVYNLMSAMKIDFKKAIDSKEGMNFVDGILSQLNSASQDNIWYVYTGAFSLKKTYKSANDPLMLSGYLSRANADILELIRRLDKN